MASVLQKTGRKMDAAWSEAISRGKRVSPL